MTTPKAKFCSRLAKLSYRAKTVRRAARRDPSYRLVPSPRMQYVKRYGCFSSDLFLTRTAFFFVTCREDVAGAAGRSGVLDASFGVDISRMPAHVYEPRTRGALFHVTNSGARYQVPELARSKRGKNKVSLFGGARGTQVFGRTEGVPSCRNGKLSVLFKAICFGRSNSKSVYR